MSEKVLQLLGNIAAAELSLDEIKLLVATILKGIPQGRYGQELVYELRRLVPSISFEGVLIRNSSTGGREVFMRRRKANETYPGQWHCPGSTLEAKEDEAAIAKRVGETRFGFDLRPGQYSLAGHYWSPVEPSSIGGTYLALVYLLDQHLVPTLPGEWHPVEQLPEDTIVTHRGIIDIAINLHYRQLP